MGRIRIYVPGKTSVTTAWAGGGGRSFYLLFIYFFGAKNQKAVGRLVLVFVHRWSG